MPRKINVGDQVRLMDRSFGIAVDTTETHPPTIRADRETFDGEPMVDYGLKVFPAYPYEDLPCLDKVGTPIQGDNGYFTKDDSYGAEDCLYTVMNIDVQALGLTCKGVREDQTLNIALRSNVTGAIIFTNTRFVETPSIVERVQVVKENVWDDGLINLTAAQRREAVAQRGW